MFRSLLLVIITIFSWSTNANVQSLTTDQGVEIRVEHREDDNYPLILTSIIDDVNKTIDKYPFEGGEPTLNGMDIIDINNHEYLIVQLIWDIRHFDISGKQYLSYIYKINKNKIELDKNLNDDENLEGFIGHYSEDKESDYKYNNIAKLENYLIKKHHDKSTLKNISMCRDNSEEVFSCTLENNKQVSLCALGSSFIYRYGTPDNIELEYPNDGEKPLDWRLIQGPSLKQEVFFNRGKYNYALSYSMDVVDLLSAEFQDTYALDVEHNGKSIFSRTCKEVSKPFPPHFGASFQ